MSVPAAIGVNWSYDGTIEIFGAMGRPISGGNWAVNALDSMFVEVSPDRISPDILAAIETDRRAGKAELIEYVAVGPRQAVVLYLEGILTLEALAEAEELPDRIIASVQLDGKAYKLLIEPDLPYRFATCSADGELL